MKSERYTPGLAMVLAGFPSRTEADPAYLQEARARAGRVFLGIRKWGRVNRPQLDLVGYREQEVSSPSLGNMKPRYAIVEALREYEYEGILHGPNTALSPHRVQMEVKADVYRGGHEKLMFLDMTFPDPANPQVSLFFRDTPMETHHGISEEDFRHPKVFSQGHLSLRIPDQESGVAIDQTFDLTTLRPNSDFARRNYGFGIYEFPGANFNYGSPDLFEYGEYLLRFLSTAKVVRK